MQFRYPASATGVAVLLALSLGHLTAAHAEAPLTVDGAETEQPGSFELSVEVFQDDSLRGAEVELGYVPVENLEVELELGAGEDQDTDPRARESEYGLSLKWVSKQTGEGISYGVKLGFGHEIEDDRQGEKEETDRIDLTGVFSYAVHRGPTLHLNLGVAREEQEDASETFMVWGLGMDYRFARRWTVAAEVYGEEDEDPAVAVGVRYKLGGDASLYARVGTQDGETFGAIGAAFEFEPD